MLWMTIGLTVACAGAESSTEAAAPLQCCYAVTIGIQLTARTGGKRYTAGTVVPTNWAEQKVELLSDEHVRCTSRVKQIPDGGAVLVMATSSLQASQQARVVYRYRVTAQSRPVRQLPGDFLAEQPRPDRRVRVYLRPSPGIESDDSEIGKLAKQLADPCSSAWEKVRAFFDWTIGNIRYREMTFTSAKRALESGEGDCEERASLFIALCRAAGIPARTVWSPGHCWAEFYLVDKQGQGHWLPAHTAGNPWFGHLESASVILQKGDNFHLRESRSPPKRLLNSWYRGVLPRPDVQFIQEIQPWPQQDGGASEPLPSQDAP